MRINVWPPLPPKSVKEGGLPRRKIHVSDASHPRRVQRVSAAPSRRSEHVARSAIPSRSCPLRACHSPHASTACRHRSFKGTWTKGLCRNHLMPNKPHTKSCSVIFACSAWAGNSASWILNATLSSENFAPPGSVSPWQPFVTLWKCFPLTLQLFITDFKIFSLAWRETSVVLVDHTD